jgi:hypothetical protein
MRSQESILLHPNLDSDLADFIARGDTSLQIAEKIAEVARATAPVETGRYRDGITAEKTSRGARVIASDNKSSWIEFGIPSHNQPAQFILRRAVDACGLKFEKKRQGHA